MFNWIKSTTKYGWTHLWTGNFQLIKNRDNWLISLNKNSTDKIIETVDWKTKNIAEMRVCDLSQEQHEISNKINSYELYKHEQSFK